MPDLADTNLPAKDVIRHITHELRQPLSALDSIAFYLQMTVGGEGTPLAAQVSRLQQMVDNANWVLTDALHLMQAAPPARDVVDANELLEETLQEPWIAEGMAIEWSEEVLPALWVDPEQLRHLVRSVLQFLRRTAAEPRAVILKAAASATVATITFVANAPEASTAEMFEPLAANQLYTSRRIAESNGGRLAAAKDDGGRLSIEVELPVAVTA